MTEKCYWFSGPLVIKGNQGKYYCSTEKKLLNGDSNCNESDCKNYLMSGGHNEKMGTND